MPEQVKQHFGDQDKYQLNTTKNDMDISIDGNYSSGCANSSYSLNKTHYDEKMLKFSHYVNLNSYKHDRLLAHVIYTQ